jgi:hypothetical protein
MSIFDEEYRVISVEENELIVQGMQSGDVLTINLEPKFPLLKDDYPVGKLITLSDPSRSNNCC